MRANSAYKKNSCTVPLYQGEKNMTTTSSLPPSNVHTHIIFFSGRYDCSTIHSAPKIVIFKMGEGGIWVSQFGREELTISNREAKQAGSSCGWRPWWVVTTCSKPNHSEWGQHMSTYRKVILVSIDRSFVNDQNRLTKTESLFCLIQQIMNSLNEQWRIASQIPNCTTNVHAWNNSRTIQTGNVRWWHKVCLPPL
jgi:hypothetical protein